MTYLTLEQFENYDITTLSDDGVVELIHDFYQSNPDIDSWDLSKWDTSNVTNMSYMFDRCYALESLDVSSWDTLSVTDMWRMFCNCSSLTSLDVSSWDTSNVTNMSLYVQTL